MVSFSFFNGSATSHCPPQGPYSSTKALPSQTFRPLEFILYGAFSLSQSPQEAQDSQSFLKLQCLLQMTLSHLDQFLRPSTMPLELMGLHQKIPHIFNSSSNISFVFFFYLLALPWGLWDPCTYLKKHVFPGLGVSSLGLWHVYSLLHYDASNHVVPLFLQTI